MKVLPFSQSIRRHRLAIERAERERVRAVYALDFPGAVAADRKLSQHRQALNRLLAQQRRTEN